ncbi:MAG TPA: VOC family protein [Stackebrandtia sp.]|jgi:predicted enzyme related to lactoylglutathione lyase|uniref:VOC family protein n=1 Tax=Stackebrandtia sp. TaxID=2023065 RepID=UPI002D2B980B|nr:VOC family protein [Stackebrandtia sp.]HZE39767.1 VOC family protein [Stackebrandtia sp.]
MGNPVVHFEIEGRDGETLRDFYSELFDWRIDADNPAKYGLVSRDDNLTADGVGIGGAVFEVPETPSTTWRGPTRAEGYGGHVTIFVEVDDVEAALAHAERLGGERLQGPDEVMGGLVMGKFRDPDGHLVGLVGSRRGA